MENAREFKGWDSVFATRFRKIMEETKTTQDILAKATGVTRQAIAQYCDGSTMPNIERLYLFAKHFKVSTDFLLGNTEVQKPDTNIQTIAEYTSLSERSIYVLNTDSNKIYGKLINLMLESTTEKGNILLRLYRYLSTSYGDEILEYSRNIQDESEIRASVKNTNEESKPFICDGKTFVPTLTVPLKQITEQTLLNQIMLSIIKIKDSNLFKL